MNYSSTLLDETVNELSKFPGIGRKSALRMALHLLKMEESKAMQIGQSIITFRQNIQYCTSCGNISDLPVCSICSNPSRSNDLICVVEDIRDVMAIESTAQFKGVYHILGGIISPVDGIGPDQIKIQSLIEKVGKNAIREVILALPATIEGETTMHYISKKLMPFSVNISVISRGISVGGSLEYADELTLGRSISGRIPFNSN